MSWEDDDASPTQNLPGGAQCLVLLESSLGHLGMQPGLVLLGCSLLFLRDFSIFPYTEALPKLQTKCQRI